MYYRMGQLVCMAFLQGATGFHILSESVYNYIIGMKISDIIVGKNEVADVDAITVMTQVYLL